jgi:hypothetical protein
MIPLPSDYTPHRFDVLCAKGREAKNHSGNVHYRRLIKQALPRYSKACCKLDKTIIVSEIVDKVQSSSPLGGFIRREKLGNKKNNNNNNNNKDGDVNNTATRFQYYEVGDRAL